MDRRTKETLVWRSEQGIAWLVFILLLVYTLMELIYAPYLGFDFNPTNGTILEVYQRTSTLQPGDKICSIGGLNFEVWSASLRRPLIDSAQVGSGVPLQINCDSAPSTIQWAIGEPTWSEFFARIINSWPLGYLFWLAGFTTLLTLRPRTARQQLFALFFFLTAIWIVTGSVSRRNLWDVSIVFRMAIWLSVPVYLHLHWSFPKSLRPLPRFVFPLLYLLGGLAALLQWFELLPKVAYVLGFGVALLGSLAFLAIHYVRRKDERQRLAVILYSFALALLPSALLGIVSALNLAPRLGGMALLTLPILPAGYFYAIYRHQFGGVELRTNRLIARFVYLIVLGSGVLVVGAAFAVLPTFPGRNIVAVLATSLAATLITLTMYPRFERWVEIRILGIPYPPEDILESYLLRITTSLRKSSLVHILSKEVMPSLLIRQSALLLTKGSNNEILYADGISDEAIPPLPSFLEPTDASSTHQLHPREAEAESGPWVRLSIPLTLGEQTLGIWLLGKHDPDDTYTGRTIAILENIARQTAMALVNIEQAEQLQLFYRADIQRHEEERSRLARTLHDEILNQAALIYTSLEPSALTEKFEREYRLLDQQTRRMINNLRPATLQWGLHIALENLADELNERSNGSPFIEFAIPYTDVRYPPECEEQIYRIVQQACENAMRHARASRIQIVGSLTAITIGIQVIDDGIGFDAKGIRLTSFMERRQYGLMGMYERARVIGAEFEIESADDQGTTIHLRWSTTSSPNPPSSPM